MHFCSRLQTAERKGTAVVLQQVMSNVSLILDGYISEHCVMDVFFFTENCFSWLEDYLFQFEEKKIGNISILNSSDSKHLTSYIAVHNIKTLS